MEFLNNILSLVLETTAPLPGMDIPYAPGILLALLLFFTSGQWPSRWPGLGKLPGRRHYGWFKIYEDDIDVSDSGQTNQPIRCRL